MKKISAFVVLLGMIFTISACSNTVTGSYNWDMDNFVATTQDDKEFSNDDLKGKIWVTDFMFTSCETVCPPMTTNMKRIQKMVAEEGLSDEVGFLSLSVDPTIDTSAELTTFAKKMNVDQSNWVFLTGYDQQFIEDFAKDTFRTIVSKPEQTDQVIHDTKFFLIDKEGKVIKSYSGVSKTPYDEIIKDIKTLSR